MKYYVNDNNVNLIVADGLKIQIYDLKDTGRIRNEANFLNLSQSWVTVENEKYFEYLREITEQQGIAVLTLIKRNR
jgi:hypothetical protein